MTRSGWLVAFAVSLFATGAVAQQTPTPSAADRSPASWQGSLKNAGVSELRGGIMFDDVEMYPTAPFWFVPQPDSYKWENVDTASVDVLFDSPDAAVFKWLGSPRPVVGADLNFKHESMVHASLNWHLPIADTGFFAEGELGGALHDGTLSGAVPPMRNLGCRALFYWSINIGYQIDQNWSVMATEQHASQAGLCGWDDNQGLNYHGIRIGYRF